MRRRPAAPSYLPVSRGVFLIILAGLTFFYWGLAYSLERIDLTALLNGYWQGWLPGAPPLPGPLVSLVGAFHPVVLRHFIPVITGWVLAYLAAVSLTRILYDLPDSGAARRFLGRLVGETAQGPAVTVSSKTLAKLRESSELLRVGGPGLIVVPAGEVAVTEIDGRFHRILPSGRHKISRFEYVHALLDLRNQERHLAEIPLVTRDGIEISADLTLTFRIDPGGAAPTRDNPFPHNPEAVRLAAYAEISRDAGQIFTWQDAPGNMARSALAGIITKYRLDELLHPQGRNDPYATLNQELTRGLRAALVDVGLELLNAHIGRLELPAIAAEQYIERWQADLDADIRLSLAEGEARALAEREIARAEAEVIMIQAILEGLYNAQRAGGVGTMREVVALRMVEALEKMARQSQTVQPLPPNLLPQLLDWQRALGTERQLPAQRQGSD